MCPRQHVRHEVVKVAEGWHWIVYGISQRVVEKSPCCEKPENKTYRIKPISLSIPSSKGAVSSDRFQNVEKNLQN
jgi:hypothetical protein